MCVYMKSINNLKIIFIIKKEITINNNKINKILIYYFSLIYINYFNNKYNMFFFFNYN